jgi:hypothetical protein
MMGMTLAFVAHPGRSPAMDGPEFDAWTRRRFGLAAGGSLATLVGLATADARQKRKKRCRKFRRACKPGGKRKCCGDLKCRATGFAGEFPPTCCKTDGKPCAEQRDCCQGLCCGGPEGDRTCTELCVSDRALKANFGTIDPTDMLERVRALPISTWNYTSDDPAVRHIGPMAQDFAATFGVGVDDRHIHPLDGQGVALAAIQGLLNQIEALREENVQLAARIAALEDGGR